MKPEPWKTIATTLLIGLLTVAAIPESQRSRAAIQRVRPELERALRAKGVLVGTPIFIRIFKEEKELELWVHDGRRFTIFRKYPMCHFSGDLGPKLREGDQQSPEGFYSLAESHLNPSSRFHLSFNIGYPNAYDRSQRRTGSAIMVHGACVSTGCYAMTNPTIEEIYSMADAALRNGQKSFQEAGRGCQPSRSLSGALSRLVSDGLDESYIVYKPARDGLHEPLCPLGCTLFHKFPECIIDLRLIRGSIRFGCACFEKLDDVGVQLDVNPDLNIPQVCLTGFCIVPLAFRNRYDPVGPVKKLFWHAGLAISPVLFIQFRFRPQFLGPFSVSHTLFPSSYRPCEHG